MENNINNHTIYKPKNTWKDFVFFIFVIAILSIFGIGIFNIIEQIK